MLVYAYVCARVYVCMCSSMCAHFYKKSDHYELRIWLYIVSGFTKSSLIQLKDGIKLRNSL